MQKQLRAALMGLQFYATDIAKPKPDVGDIRLGLLSCLEKKKRNNPKVFEKRPIFDVRSKSFFSA